MSAERISWFVLFPLELWFAQNHRWVAVGICVVVSILVLTFRQTIGNIRVIALMRARTSQQVALDKNAEKYLRSIASDRRSKSRPLILFLRPFSSDRAIRAKDPATPDGYDVASLETRLADGFVRRFTTISFANEITGPDIWGDAFADMGGVTPYHPDFYKYQGRLFYRRPGEVKAPDVNWLDTFRLLARNAGLILSVPIDSSLAPGQSATILELLDLNANNMLERCLFVMPPDQTVWFMRPSDETETRRGTGASWMTRKLQLSALWESTRAKLASGGVRLPEFRDTTDGATVFVLRGNHCIVSPVPSSELSDPSSYLKALKLSLPSN
jgi:hypothetical protein